MLGNAFGWPHLLIILAIVLLFFGAPKLPGLARSLGQSMRIFKGEMKTMKSDDAAKRGDTPAITPSDTLPTEHAATRKPVDDGADTGSETRPKP